MRDTQLVFISEISIFEGCIVASEVRDDLMCSGDGMIFKFDFKKANDCVN